MGVIQINMKNKKLNLLSVLAFASVALSGCKFIQIVDNKSDESQKEDETQKEEEKKEEEQHTSAYDEEKQAQRIQEYYADINSSESGTTLLNSLRTLNLAMRKSTVGYDSMGTSASGKFKYTDYDPATVKFNKNGVPYGTKIISFYSGKITSSFNREHTWPNSRDGNLVEDDILMTRPTITAENSDRGNSVYVTGETSSSNGWDPVAAFEDNIGVYQSIRGECARIIFYCMTASGSLVLNDETSNQGNNMGKLTNLIQWACENPVNDREKRRNVGAEALQGNRNAFVDHPEYACKIWGSHNAATKSACQKANYPIN